MIPDLDGVKGIKARSIAFEARFQQACFLPNACGCDCQCQAGSLLPLLQGKVLDFSTEEDKEEFWDVFDGFVNEGWMFLDEMLNGKVGNGMLC